MNKPSMYFIEYIFVKWRPPSLSELTLMLFNTGLTHLGSEVSICYCTIIVSTLMKNSHAIYRFEKFKILNHIKQIIKNMKL